MVRESLVILDGVTAKNNRNMVQISKTLATFILFLFVACVVATGLLVYDLFPHVNNTNLVESEITRDKTVPEAAVSTDETKTDSDLDVRLPKSVIPDSYKLKLIPFLQEGNFTFHGEVNILVNVTDNSNNITLHADDLFIHSVSVTDVNQNTVSIMGVRRDEKKQFLIIDLDKEVQSGSQYYIFIEFKGVLNDLLEGFYRSSYVENNEKRWIAVTQFQATDARKSFPCFDEPAFKAKFQINIARLKNMTSISNMRKTHSSFDVTNLPDYVWDHYEESVPMSTYLVAFVVSDFECITDRTSNFSIWARRSAINQAHFSFEIGPKILKYYEEFFGIKYPLHKLDMVAVPDLSDSGMENWGLITYREPFLLYEKGVSSKTSLHAIAHMVAHELAHQWFGNLVTPTWWTDLWLNEGFATYVQYLGAYAVEPRWKDPDLFVVEELHGAFGLDALKSSHPISIKVNNPDEISDIFDRISYSKGASIIRMMQHFLSANVFHSGVNKYLVSRLYGNAEQDDLWATLTEVGHENNVLEKNVNIKQIMDTWTLQTGYPLITAVRNSEAYSLTLTQERFYLDRENQTETTLWWIPITYTDRRNNYKTTWMRQEPEIVLSDVVINDDDWFLINVNQTGYYRVNYDLKNWQIITRQLQRRNGHVVFDPKNRAQLLDDAFNLASSGYISYDIALNVTLYLIHEREYIALYVGMRNLDSLYNMFVRTAHFDKYKSYILHLIRDYYNELGFRDSNYDDPLTIHSRMLILHRACRLGLRDCILRAVQKFQNWRKSANPDKNNNISTELRATVYCTAIAEGGHEEWEFAWQRYLATNVANEKDILLQALGCSKEIWILSRYLEWAISENSGIRKHDCGTVFTSVSEHPIGQDLTYRFLKTNWNKIRSYLGKSSFDNIVGIATAHFNTEDELNDFKSILNQKRSEIGSRTAQQIIEQAEANVKWTKRYFNTILNWLSKVNL